MTKSDSGIDSANGKRDARIDRILMYVCLAVFSFIGVRVWCHEEAIAEARLERATAKVERDQFNRIVQEMKEDLKKILERLPPKP